MGDHVPSGAEANAIKRAANAARAEAAASAGTPSSGGQAENYGSMVGTGTNPFMQMMAAQQHHQIPRHRGALSALARGANNFDRNRNRLLASRAVAAAPKPATTRGKCWGSSCTIAGGRSRRSRKMSAARFSTKRRGSATKRRSTRHRRR